MTKPKKRLRDSKGRFVKTKKVAVLGKNKHAAHLDEKSFPDIQEVSLLPEVPEGMTRIADGRIIKTTDRIFYLKETVERPDIMLDRKGVAYQKKNGTLRRISPKLTKKQRRAAKEEARSTSHT